MRSARIFLSLAAWGLLWLAASVSAAQQVTVGTPFHSVGDSFFERLGTNWGFNWKGLNVSFGGPNMAVPQFGSFDPNAGINGGFGVQGGNFNGFFNFSAGQGFRQSFVSQTPSITLTNGYPGYFADTSQTPFVMGFIPVVGGFVDGFPLGYRPYYTTGFPYAVPPVQPIAQGNPRVQAMLGRLAAGNQAPGRTPAQPPPAGLPRGGPAVAADPALEKLAGTQSSSAGRAVPSVAEARRLYELEKAAGNAARNNEAKVYCEKARTAEEGGRPAVAKIYYNMALKKASGELRERIQARLKALSSPDAAK